MELIQSGSRSLKLLLDINWDRIFVLGTIVAGLLAGAFLGTVLMGV